MDSSQGRFTGVNFLYLILEILLEESVSQRVYSRIQNYYKKSNSANKTIAFICYEFYSTTGIKRMDNK